METEDVFLENPKRKLRKTGLHSFPSLTHRNRETKRRLGLTCHVFLIQKSSGGWNLIRSKQQQNQIDPPVLLDIFLDATLRLDEREGRFAIAFRRHDVTMTHTHTCPWLVLFVQRSSQRKNMNFCFQLMNWKKRLNKWRARPSSTYSWKFVRDSHSFFRDSHKSGQ